VNIRALALPVLLVFTTAPLAAQNPADTGWITRTEMVPLRDGVKLKTFIISPRRPAGPLPFLLMRTPYGAAGSARNFPGAYRFLAAEGYIFVFQDIRGRGESEGKYLMNRPFRTDSSSFDEATDTYDTVEWLVHNVAGNNGRVGGLGISYPGWLATVQAMSGHSAVKAVSPQAPMTDTWMATTSFTTAPSG
jgi:putative CocE/NonD family hydrolase